MLKHVHLQPVISVLMPVYNGSRYLTEAVESILTQSFRDFEFVIVDDGSTDDSLTILESYAAKDDRIRLISRPNTGIVGALNDGLAAARGEFVARMDADDIAMPERFSRQVDFLRANLDVVCVGCGALQIDSRGNHLIPWTLPLDDETIQSQHLKGSTSLVHPGVMFRREAVAAINGYNSAIPVAQDLDLWLRLGEKGRLANLPNLLLKYRVHDNTISNSRQQEQLAYAQLAVDHACDRRGLAKSNLNLKPYRPAQSKASRHDFSIRCGWWNFLRGDRQTALRHGMHAIRSMPWRSDGWQLLACSLLKSPSVIE